MNNDELSSGMKMEEFLEEVPLHSVQLVLLPLVTGGHGYKVVAFPENIRMHCTHEHCEGVRRHSRKDAGGKFAGVEGCTYAFVRYVCTDCQQAEKFFAIKIGEYENNASTFARCTKIYQEPAFGQPIPKRLFKVIGEANRDHFLQARRAIARGLGIGAYAYYRRIVENAKFQLVGAILEVAKATNADQAQLKTLEQAGAETQFSKALILLKDASAVPAVLLIDGHNPLAILHDLLSEGIHALSDADCLERAKDAEIILCEISDRMQVALTERKNVKTAIGNAMNRKGSGPSSSK